MMAARVLLGLIALILAATTLSAAFANANLHGGFADQMQVFFVLPWGRDILVQGMAGYAFVILIIWMFERTWILAVLLSLPLLILGHAWTALWLALRLPKLIARLSRPDWPTV